MNFINSTIIGTRYSIGKEKRELQENKSKECCKNTTLMCLETISP